MIPTLWDQRTHEEVTVIYTKLYRLHVHTKYTYRCWLTKSSETHPVTRGPQAAPTEVSIREHYGGCLLTPLCDVHVHQHTLCTIYSCSVGCLWKNASSFYKQKFGYVQFPHNISVGQNLKRKHRGMQNTTGSVDTTAATVSSLIVAFCACTSKAPSGIY